MFITKMSLSRRTVLRGMGATLALPLLEAMVPALTATAQTAANPVRRFGAVFIPMGERPGYWTPATTGADFAFMPIMKPLESLRDSLVVVSNLDRPTQGTHVVSCATWLTGSAPKRTEAEDILAGTSVDQLIANKIGQDTVFPSLEVATEDVTGYIGACDTGYSCAYMNTLSWRSPTAPLPMELNPRVVFERMFGRPGTAAQRLTRQQEDRSILDSVRGDVADLQRGLGARDRGRLDEYIENVRELEQRIQKAERRAHTDAALPPAPIGVPESFDEHVGLLFDLLAVAYEADLTRVFSFMMNREASMKIYPELGITEPHHHVSHHGNDPEKIANLVKLNTHHVSLFAKFLNKLQSTPDGDGTLLDHSTILYGSGMSESNSHSPLDVPLLIAGSGCGLIKGNRHLKAAKDTQLANVMLDMANKFGVEIDRFGVSTGRFQI
jgi:hypothetical protein